MNNNNLGRVAVRTASRKRVPTPLNFDVNATASVGSVMPFMLRECVAGSKPTVKTRSLIRLATMLVPTYGRMKLNLRHYFVGMSDLTENFAALLAKTPISRGVKTFTPLSLPFMSKGFLSLFSLVGSHVTLYRNFSSYDDTRETSECRLYKAKYGAPATENRTLLTYWMSPPYQNDTVEQGMGPANNGDFYKQHMPEAWRDSWNGYDGPALNIAKFFYNNSAFPVGSQFWIPIENKDWTTFFDITAASSGSSIPSYYDTSVVPLDKADAVVGYRNKGGTLTDSQGQFAFRFSSFGQRWFNLLISSGVGVDYNDFAASRSVMPLFAYYKAYWESFGLELYKKWETTPVVKMLRYYDDNNGTDFGAITAVTGRAFIDTSLDIGDYPADFAMWWCNFVCDVCTAFYTEEQDFTSAHTRTPTVSQQVNSPYPFGANLPNNTSNVTPNNPTQNEPSSAVGNDGMPFITGGTFTQLDLETLKRMAKQVNLRTIAGQNIAKLLEVQGYGDYVKSLKSRFIGEFEVPIDIDEITATSDAFDSQDNPRSLLGEQGAKGVGFGESKTFTCGVTRELGYYVVLASIVPESGYVNLAMAQAQNLRKNDFYTPDYDGLGYEANTKELTVSGQVDWTDSVDAPRMSGVTFGFAPRYSRHKIQPNFALGGFAMRSERDYYRSFFMDKVVDVQEREVTGEREETEYYSWEIRKLTPVSRIPVASPNWRYVGRYPWLENYLRIFAETGDPKRKNYVFYASLSDFVSTFFDFTFRDADKFIVQNRFLFNLSAPWLKITDAYETKEDGNVGKSDTSIGKE